MRVLAMLGRVLAMLGICLGIFLGIPVLVVWLVIYGLVAAMVGGGMVSLALLYWLVRLLCWPVDLVYKRINPREDWKPSSSIQDAKASYEKIDERYWAPD